ncbi:Uncharacterised protein [Halioglobus japonicus]|nr:Uncharacterised protein [Halioglobus japonicus]
MGWLEAAAAFSVVMMVFSTMATVVLETIHRVFRMRERGLTSLIQQTYSQVIIPQLKRQFTIGGATTFQEKATALHGKTATRCLLNPLSTKLKELSTAGFIERLAQTEEGQTLYLEAQRKGQAYLNRSINEIASKYEAFGDSASQMFQRRSRLVSCIVGVILAFLLNLDAVHLFTTLLTDQKVRVELIQRGDQIGQQAQSALIAFEAGKISADDKENLAAIRAGLQDSLNAKSTIASHGIPIGWETAPWKQEHWVECVRVTWLQWTCGTNVFSSLKWFFYVLLGGLLVGLGSPFWFDTFSRLSGLVRRVRNPQTPVQQAKEVATGKEAAIAESLDLPAVFEEAARVALTAHLSGRPILDTDGSVIRDKQS